MFSELNGKLISLVGAPGTGKTFLAKKLEKILNAKITLEEGPEGFPIDIQTNLAKRENLFETILWFRNKQVNDFLAARRLSRNSNVPVVIETPYYQSQLFVELYINEPFQKQILIECGALDFQMYGEPDITVYLKSTSESVRAFLELRTGERSWENQEWVDFISKMPPMVDHLMKRVGHNDVLVIDRLNYDFEKLEDIEKLLGHVQSLILKKESTLLEKGKSSP